MMRALRRAALTLAVIAAVIIGAPAFAHAQAAWVAPAGEKDKKNPLPADAQTIAQGKKVADVNCVSCHGAKGKGDGAAAVALNPKNQEVYVTDMRLNGVLTFFAPQLFQ